MRTSGRAATISVRANGAEISAVSRTHESTARWQPAQSRAAIMREKYGVTAVETAPPSSASTTLTKRPP